MGWGGERKPWWMWVDHLLFWFLGGLVLIPTGVQGDMRAWYVEQCRVGGVRDADTKNYTRMVVTRGLDRLDLAR